VGWSEGRKGERMGGGGREGRHAIIMNIFRFFI
jgi:hypothetical protein